jgi:hypothetical protein
MNYNTHIIDGTQAIKQPGIREILDKMIVFPTVQRTGLKRLPFPNEHSALIGYAVEILLDFHLNQDLDLGETAHKYYRPFERFVERCEKTYGCSSEKLLLFEHYNVYSWNAHPNKKLAQNISDGTNVLLLSDVRQSYVEALLTIGNSFIAPLKSKEFYLAILTVAHIYPTLRRWRIGIKRLYWDRNEILEPLMLAHDRIEMLFKGQQKTLTGQVNLREGKLRCRPDFILDRTLLEIKCTREYLTKEHIRQVALYYLVTRMQRGVSNFKIDTIQIFYGLHGELISWPAEELLPRAKVNYWLKKLKAELE